MIDSSLFSGWDVLELFFHLLSIEFGFQEYYGCFAKGDGIGLSEQINKMGPAQLTGLTKLAKSGVVWVLGSFIAVGWSSG